MHRVDAMSRARKRPYIFDANCTMQQAQTLRLALNGHGVTSVVVPMDYFTELGASHMLNNANCLPECFEIEPLTGDELKVDWQDIAMIGYGRVKHRRRRVRGSTGADGGGPMATLAAGMVAGHAYAQYRASNPMLGSGRAAQEKMEVVDCLDIFIGYIEEDVFAAHFRMLANKFYYDYLGDRKQQSSAANFRLFVEDIIGFATRTILTGKTRLFVAGQPSGKPIEGFKMFDEYNRWSVAIGRARAEGAAT